MKILYIYYYCNLGGVASVIKQRWQHLKSKGYEIELIFYMDSGGKEEWGKLGVPVYILNENRSVNVFDSMILKPLEDKVIEHIKKNKYDIITLFDMPELYKKVKSACNSSKVIYEIHSPIPKVLKRNTPDKTINFEYVFVPSEYQKKICYENYNIKKKIIEVVPNLVDTLLFTYHNDVKKHTKKIIGWVGKLGSYKNWEESLKIFKKLSKKRNDIVFRFFTGGNINTQVQDKFMNLLSKYNLMDKLLWVHNLPYEEMPMFYSMVAKSNGVLLSSSKYESFCMVLHEAMRCNVPVVSSNIGPIPEYITDKENGFLYELGGIGEAVQKINQLLDNHELYNKFIEKSNEMLKRYEPEMLINKYIDLLES